jgi:anti-sigma regulatory factor (Ser/Thr protein kinase)
LVLDQRFDIDGLYMLRAAASAFADRLGLSREQVESLLIVASELANNAILHGGGSGRLRLWRTGDQLYCQVTDNGPGIADRSTGISRPPQNDRGGRGLWVTRQLSEHVSISNDADGTAVTATMLLADAR